MSVAYISYAAHRQLKSDIAVEGGRSGKSRAAPARLHQRATRGFKLDPNRPPYPGIHVSEAEDAPIYFGRDGETRAVIERLHARLTQGGARLLVVIGASGSGSPGYSRPACCRSFPGGANG